MDEFEHWLNLVVGAIGSIVTAAAGVAMKHAHKAQHGEAVQWSLFWLYIPTIFVMGLGGHAAGTWLHIAYGMPDLFGSFLSAWLGFLGPEWVQRRVEEYIDKNKPKE